MNRMELVLLPLKRARKLVGAPARWGGGKTFDAHLEGTTAGTQEIRAKRGMKKKVREGKDRGSSGGAGSIDTPRAGLFFRGYITFLPLARGDEKKTGLKRPSLQVGANGEKKRHNGRKEKR